MEKKHDLIFCPQCGVKLEGDEIICSVCGFRLVEENKAAAVTPPPPPPVNTTPPPVQQTIVPPPPPVQAAPPPPQQPPQPQQAPITSQPVYQAPVQQVRTANPKKGMGAGGWILIILLIIVVGCGTAVGLHYFKVVNIEFINQYIPQKQDAAEKNNTADPTRYYIVHSFAYVNSKWQAIVSDIIVSRHPNNTEEGAKTQFKKAIQHEYPSVYSNFYNNAISNKYMTLALAQSARSSLLKSYDSKGYDIKTINFSY